MIARILVGIPFAVAVLVLAACGGSSGRPATGAGTVLTETPGASSAPQTTTPTLAPIAGPTLWAVGDIGDCASAGDEGVASLLAADSGAIATLGDTVYDAASAAEFARCFEPAWGPLKSRIRPAIGNHDYGTAGGRDYFTYFGAPAGELGRGYYSYDIGAWHLIVLDSNCADVKGGCAKGSPQYAWLTADLAAHPALCSIAYYHHPRFTSGLHGDTTGMADLWQALYDGGVDIALSGHDHHYERFAAMDGGGAPDPARGIREFIAGTGGGTLYPLFLVAPNSEKRDANTFGALQFTLGEGRYSWRFVPIAGQSFTDAGTGACH